MSAIVLAGSNVTFSVGMSDYTCQFAYTWRHIANILGATNPTYTVYDVQPPPSNKAGPYSVVVGNVSGSVASMDANLTVVTAPRPSSASVAAGGDASFSVLVAGQGPATYQWRLNGEEIPGANSATLSLTNVQSVQAGAYSATVCNPAGCVTTPAAILRVNAERPRLWGVVWRPDGVRFQVTGTPMATYRIQASRGFKNWTDMATYTAPESGQFEVFDPDAASIDWRCYRALQQ